MKRKGYVQILAVLMFLLLCACTSGEKNGKYNHEISSKEESIITVTDIAGREVVLEKPIKTFVYNNQAALGKLSLVTRWRWQTNIRICKRVYFYPFL